MNKLDEVFLENNYENWKHQYCKKPDLFDPSSEKKSFCNNRLISGIIIWSENFGLQKKKFLNKKLAKTIITEKKFWKRHKNELRFELNLYSICHFITFNFTNILNRKNRPQKIDTVLDGSNPTSNHWKKQFDRTTIVKASLIFRIQINRFSQWKLKTEISATSKTP